MRNSTTRRLHPIGAAGTCLLSMLALLVSPPAQAEVSELRMSPIVRAVQNVRPSVVNIQGRKTVADTDKGVAGATRQVNGMGTGVVVDGRGYVLTNFHVVDGVRQIRVTLDDGSVRIARLVANDRKTDLAVIKIDAGRSLPTIEIGSSADLMTGETVIAVGNAYGYEHTVTRGIISALGRDVQVSDTQSYDDLIQTDASINPGNSGGPLLNIEGRMVGVNVAVRAGAQGIGFAIPVDDALKVTANLMSVERLESKWHGVTTGVARDGAVTVSGVAKGSPAARSGIRVGDRIEQVAGAQVQRSLDVERALLGQRVGEALPVAVRRGERRLELRMALAQRGADSPVLDTEPIAVAADEDDAAWEVLGLALDVEPRSTFASLNTKYRGGMRVLDVRAGSPAAQKGIVAGDILVGMHRWETASEDDIRYIVTNRTLATMPAVKFYVLRDGETLFGEMPVASVRSAAVRR
ncbi:trypsin-like peptidase domain-containing protein [Botrimarina hoheduenensis]|uniref:Putative serine protease HhoB n=1 Tax=Botrimarina hoheduenensis TaxID=2528000 RepID=A0A5C5WEF5_9BACT|nr:trypsin-like peptidase domain-containing protein [Botrimarina hoheduenensis]TWT48451.1 putative serine protease HhoB precursor [Botrimarina hoheduenensis]